MVRAAKRADLKHLPYGFTTHHALRRCGDGHANVEVVAVPWDGLGRRMEDQGMHDLSTFQQIGSFGWQDMGNLPPASTT